MTKWPIGALAVLLGVWGSAADAQSIIRVNTTTNTFGDGACSLQEAISASNLNRNGDVTADECMGTGVGDSIRFSGVTVINVTSALPIITEQVTITGPTARVVLNGPGTSPGINGLHIDDTAPGTVVRRLVLQNFAFAGIRVEGANSIIAGNFIGTDAAGNAAAPNGWGVVIVAPGVRVGGTTGITPGGACSGDCNVISGNTNVGIVVDGTSAMIQGNHIGTNAAGTASVYNLFGVQLGGNSTATIGGTLAAAANLISGNRAAGIYFFVPNGGGAGSSVLGNRIGTNAAGTAALANETGIDLKLFGNPYPVVIGGPAAGSGNVISGNTGHGISLLEAENTVIQGNRIGTLADGATPLGNLGAGVALLLNAAPSPLPNRLNTIGGGGAGEGNVIASNAMGVLVGNDNFDNTIVGNSIHDNLGKGIQLDDGQNGTVTTPSITAINPVSGDACLGCRVDVYSDGADEGRTYHGAAFADAVSGDWSFPGEVDGPYVTATATSTGGSTSEFSAPFLEDSDGDARADVHDNCTLVANQDQYDANQDGYGNICDADLNDTNLVTAGDYVILRNALNTNNAVADLNHSGLVTAQDYIILRNRLNTAPGPSGFACAGSPPCPD
jgi:hypothetical protein